MMSWLNDTVIYEILIDRFAGYAKPENWYKPEFIGGNIDGIIASLGYLNELGVNTILLSPFYKGVSYHGYDVTDYYSVDPHFGTEKDLKRLLDLAHKRGIRVICDFVPDHCSDKHPYFQDAIRNKDSQYREWFTFTNWPQDYLCFKANKELPKINLDFSPAHEDMLNVGRKWLELGFDGFRINHVIGLSNKNLKDLVLPLHREFPDAIFIGEAWFHDLRWSDLKTIRIPNKRLIWFLGESPDMLYRNYDGILDGVLDFRVAKYLEDYALAPKRSTELKFLNRLASQVRTYSGSMRLPVFLDNHDMERILFRCGGDVQRLIKAADLQFVCGEPVIIYYGTEVGLSQDKAFSQMPTNPELQSRKPMTWDRPRQNLELFAFYQNRIRQRLSKK